MDVRRLGPYPIIEPVGRSAYNLMLPRSMEIHLVFHVSLLELHVANTFLTVDVPVHLRLKLSKIAGLLSSKSESHVL